MLETLLIKPIRGFLNYFSNLVTGFPSTYHSAFIDEDSPGEKTPFSSLLYQAQTLLHSPLGLGLESLSA